jgi:ABC-type branched-subunit amino acid transport system ATPase component
VTQLRIEGVTKSYGETLALNAIDLEIGSGELFFLLGPSGCGKTTLLRLIAGLQMPSAGRILFDGRDVTSVPTQKRNAVMCANLIAGGLMVFAFTMLEVSDSLILVQKQSYWPITRGIYELFQRLGDGPYIASALGAWAMLLLTLILLAVNSLLGKRVGALFRI